MTETAWQLREKRVKIYCKEVINAACALTAIQKILGIIDSGKVPPMRDRVSNFEKFVQENFSSTEHSFDAINPWPTNKTNIKAYKLLQEYSGTSYGAVMIKRVLQDNKKVGMKRFSVRLDDNKTANANTHFISFPSDFPLKEYFPGGEKIDPLAVIHHEFGHTRFFTQHTHTALVSIHDERVVVINNSNPVRMLNKFEPRYTYYDGLETINIITGKKKPGRWSYDKADPRILVPAR